MKLGFFIMPVHPPARDYAQTLREDRDAFILADQLGYSEGYCGEHLTDLAENIPSSLTFVASLAGSTSRIRLGTAVVNLPFSHPLLVATQAALVDNLLQGRLLLGIGAGILRTDMEAMELLDADRGAMFAEAIDHILALWSAEPPYNLTGKFWNISTAKTRWPEIGLGGVVKPLQKPHPPILGTATDPASKGLIALGRRGWWPISSHFLHQNHLLSQWNNYAQGCAEGGHKADRANWRVARSIFVADDDKVARAYGGADASSPYRFYMNQLTAKLKKGNKLGGFKERLDMPDEDLTLDYIFDNVVIRGSVNRVVDGILALHERIGDFGTLLYCGKDWVDPTLSRKSMELMAEKVMPAVNAAIGQRVAAAAE
jgi:alkanesulfonate monooxygenase SsuD/methylene tetrahydromethanopterin reductase-like flavin-dependent oxidoreductase (luciferase family)